MYLKHFYACITLAGLLLCTGCHSKVDLTNIDKQAEVELGVALPVGSLRATIGDFIGANTISKIYVDEEGVYHFIDTVDIPHKDYHKVDLSKYILENQKALQFGIKDQVGKSVIKGNGEDEIMLEFEVKLSTENFNTNTAEERIDSIQIANASFTSIIGRQDFDLNWSEIRKVELVLGNQFNRRDGKIIRIPISGYKYNEEIPIDIEDFSINMMDPSGGTVDKIKLKIRFYLCPNKGHDITLTDDSKFSYELKVKVIDYDAVWGYFQAGNDMRDAQRLNLDSVWEDWKNIKKLKVRFMEPSIDILMWHHIAAPLRMYIDYIRAIDASGKVTRATWNESESYSFDLPPLSPFSPHLTDSVTCTQTLSYDPKEGHIDELFNVRPDYFEYSFYLLVDKNYRPDFQWSQHRITRNTKIQGFATADVPFVINQGSEMEYTTILSDVDISSFSLDSIIASVNLLDSMKATDVKLILEVENGLPFAVEGKFTFLNKDSVDMKLQLFVDNEDNHLIFPAPKMERTAGNKFGTVVNGTSLSRFIVSVDKNDFNRLSEIGYIRMDVALTDNPEPCCITKSNYLKVKIGLAAHVDAILNFGNEDNNNGNDK